MSFLREELNKIAQLYGIIEGRKKHGYAAPTYKDSPYLTEMAQIVLAPRAHDKDTLEELIPALGYLAESYDGMCRAGMSVKIYTPLLKAHTELIGLKGYDDKGNEELENCFFMAVKARNFYEPDDCADLVSIVSDILSAEKIRQILVCAKDRRNFIKNDPVEKTEQYLAVIDEVEERIDQEKTTDLCFEHWSLKRRFLLERGILWRSPAQLNPTMRFD